jgi:serine protease AprX
MALLIAVGARPASAELITLPALIQFDALAKLDPLTQARLLNVTGSSRVIVRGVDGVSLVSLETVIRSVGGTVRQSFSFINAHVVDLPNASLDDLAASPLVARISLDRLMAGAMERTGATVRATAVRQELGFDGTGIGVAVIDSGVTTSHDDLTSSHGASTVVDFEDYVNGRAVTYDDYGHGTHVAGIVAGNGFDSGGARSGIAPGAHLISLKVLDAAGRGHISDVIAALEYVIAHKDVFNIRVANLSVATGVYESYNSDPLTLAASRAVEAGIVVVAAAGNRGRDANGRDAYGGVTAPGNAPWVLTVGASSHMGTTRRWDDTMAAFSSRGPGAVDRGAKPDLVAPGVGIESLSDPYSTFYTTKSKYLLSGTVATWYLPYLSLSGTSMAAPVVSGTVALMLQADPALTPNLVKAILQYTSQVYSSYDPLTEGAGFLNAKGAVDLARFLGQSAAGSYPTSSSWSRRLIWGNKMVSYGRLLADGTAWPTDVAWGATTSANGQRVDFGAICTSGCDGASGTWSRWQATQFRNVVWGSACGGADCQGSWTVQGASDDDSVVWGTDDADSVVWGTDDDDSVVWGTSCGDPACEPVVWPHP